MNEINLSSQRAKKARIGARFGPTTINLFRVIAFIALAAGLVVVLLDTFTRLGYLVIAFGLVIIIWGLWLKRDVANLPVKDASQSLDGILEQKLLSAIKAKDLPLNPKKAWMLASNQWEAVFMSNRLFVHPDDFSQVFSEDSAQMEAIWQTATQLQKDSQCPTLNSACLMYALITNSDPAKQLFSQLNLRIEDIKDVFDWVNRIVKAIDSPKPYFGGLGRDWATGYTPYLERFGQNISSTIENGGGVYHTLAHHDILDTIIYNLGNNSGNVALVGEAGTGKTSLVYALAKRLLEGNDPGLKHYQIVSLNASLMLSTAKGNLEQLLLTLMGEAIHAGNMIIFLDEAHLFFGDGTGSMDVSKVLLPILQNRQLKILLAFTPNDLQRLRVSNESFASNFSVINILEPEKSVILDILEDSALTLEHSSGLLVTYTAVKEAYRLSGQYMQEEAYPGKAIRLLDQAAAYADQKVITAESVAQAIEKTKGVKVTAVKADEADILLNLEEKIHARMINQSRAVKVLSAALRRTRAGVASGKRPVGGFLFLGPTGVGKTELAKSLAAVYYGDEKQIIRLDMSEYQQPNDVDRLLGNGSEGESLILAVRKQPFSVVLLDEIEKAHPNILNLLLQMLDEGKLTDTQGKAAMFNSSIIICTSNAGSAQITEQVVAGKQLEEFERPLIDSLIASGQFKPELINRFDEIVLFRPLNQQELTQVAVLMLGEVNANLANQNISVQLTDEALVKIVQAGYDPQFGARPMRRVIQKMVEDAVATKILTGTVKPGQKVVLDVEDLTKA